jgi:type II secretory pathway component PulM
MIEAFITEERLAGGGLLLGLAIWWLQKTMSFWKSESKAQAKSSAETDQFRTLQDAIATNKQETVELRAQFALMDKKIHVQQRTITRMEMLLRQFSGLVRDKGIAVPVYMQEELESLIEADAERSAE